MSQQQREYTKINNVNQRSSAGRPEGTMTVHSFGSKSVCTRMYEKEQRTLVEPSPLMIIRQVNQKHDKATQEETGKYTDPKLQTSIDRYCELYKDRYGEDNDPLSTPIVSNLWMSVEVVHASLAKGELGVAPEHHK